MYHSVLTLQRFADDRTGVWTIGLTEYVYMLMAMFVINGRDRAGRFSIRIKLFGNSE